jgi:3-phenylpropionate/trans-cinnamate dioxygenase ferredoxin reductase component
MLDGPIPAARIDASSHVVVVGAGHAGVQVAASLRELGFVGRLTLLNGDRSEPYDRPTLSKEFLSETDSPAVFLRTSEFYSRARIEITDALVSSIDPAGRRVSSTDGRSWRYDHLVLATGGRPREITLPGSDLAGVLALRTLDDAMDLRARLATSRRPVVIGGGFIGLEVAAAATARGLPVVIVEAMDRLMARVMSEVSAAAALDFHRANGVETLFGRRLTALDGSASVTGATLDDGTVLDADLVVVGVGMAADDRLAREAALDTDQGVVVDQLCRTSDAFISAIGDCAVVTCKETGSKQRFESIPNAHDQARQVAGRLLGLDSSRPGVPWFWSHQGALKLQIAGPPGPADEHVTVGDEAKFSVLCFREGRLAAVESINDAGGHMAARRILDQARPATLDLCRSHGFDLRRIAREVVAVDAAAL